MLNELEVWIRRIEIIQQYGIDGVGSICRVDRAALVRRRFLEDAGQEYGVAVVEA
jgi:hypothetical protein